MNKRIVDFLYTGFRPYVSKTELDAYDKEYLKDSRNSISFIKDFFRDTSIYLTITKTQNNPMMLYFSIILLSTLKFRV